MRKSKWQKIYNNINTKLDEVLEQQQKRKQSIKMISSIMYRKLGRIHVEVSAEEKAAMIKQVNKDYNKRIQTIYNDINTELKASGLPELKNPYK